MFLTEREKIVLSSIIINFIKTVEPVGSKTLSYKLDLGISPATIRNIMASLEEKGLITQPHTSAGRIPTSKGYKMYITNLMKRKRLSREERELIYHTLKENSKDFDSFLEAASKLLANITHQLSFLTIPVLKSSTLEKLDVIIVSNNRLLVVVYVTSGILKTLYITFQDHFDLASLDKVVSILNERLHGLKLNEIRDKFQLLIKDIPVDKYSALKVILKNYKELFDPNYNHELIYRGTNNLLLQPEFQNNPKVADVLQLIEEKEKFLTVFTSVKSINKRIHIAIGEEIPLTPLRDCSIITTNFNFGEEAGKIGIIGPQRMDYGHVIAFLEYTANAITDIINSN